MNAVGIDVSKGKSMGANALHNAGIFVSVVNALVIDDYSTNRVRKVKTDKKDAYKIANYALNNWIELREYTPTENICKTLKILNRQYIFVRCRARIRCSIDCRNR